MERQMKRLILGISIAVAATLGLTAGGLWAFTGWYCINVVLRNGGAFWVRIKSDDPRLSPSVQLALRGPPLAEPGNVEWRGIGHGFEAGELVVLAGGGEVDRLFLARIDPAIFRFEVRNAPAGDRNLGAWMTRLGAALVINGSYYSRRWAPVPAVPTAR